MTGEKVQLRLDEWRYRCNNVYSSVPHLVLDATLSKLGLLNISAWDNVSVGWKINVCEKSNTRIWLVQLLLLAFYSRATEDQLLQCKVYRSRDVRPWPWPGLKARKWRPWPWPWQFWPWPWPWHKSLGLAIFKTEARKPQCHSAPVSLSLSHTLLCQCLLKWYCLFEYAFCAPTSSAPVERIFSQSRLITRRNRARMMDSMLESLVF